MGQDEMAGGTWLGITREGRFAMVTNVRDGSKPKTAARSRGELPLGFLESDQPPETYLARVAAVADTFAGFNLMLGTLAAQERSLWFLNSVERVPRALDAGHYAVSNASLDTPWPKVSRLKQRFAIAAATDSPSRLEALRNVLRDETPAPDDELPATGVPLPWERALSPIFIRNTARAESPPTLADYGTRCSTLVVVRNQHVFVEEATHTADCIDASRVEFSFSIG